MLVRLIRHATLVVVTGGRRFLVDPMLGPAGGQPPVPETPDPRPNPLVDLPAPAEQVVAGISATVVTHLHGDHLDAVAGGLIPRDRPVLCQPRDAPALARLGLPAEPVEDALTLDRVVVARTGGRHGSGAIGAEMGEVSGFVLAAEGEPTLYVAGDTVWCDEMAAAIDAHRPDVVVVNSGAARFVMGDPITMDVADVVEVCRAAPEALVIAVHMEAMNHCGLTRDALRAGIDAAGHGGRVLTPADGETLALSF